MARNPHPEVTERRILAAAKKLFAEKGYDKTSFQVIPDFQNITFEEYKQW